MGVVVSDNGVWEVILAYEVFLGELLHLIGYNFSQWSCLDPLGEVIDVTSRYLTAPRAFGSGPNMSIPYMAKCQWELKLWRLSRGVCGMSANSWLLLHLFVKSRASALSIDQ